MLSSPCMAEEKEETRLFPALARSGVPMQGCPVGALVHEHDMGRARVAHLAEAVEAYLEDRPGAGESILKSLRALAEPYPNHIWKEDCLLFPITNKVLSEDEQQALLEAFDRVEEGIGADVHRRFLTLAATLEAMAERSPEDLAAEATPCQGASGASGIRLSRTCSPASAIRLVIVTALFAVRFLSACEAQGPVVRAEGEEKEGT